MPLRIAAWAAHILPQPVKRWLYQFPPLANLIRASLNRAAPSGLTETTIAAGILAGFKMILNLQTEKDYWLGTYEPDLQAAARELVKSGMVVYDIGGNIGYISLMMARLCTPGGQVFSFEALPANLKRLEENIQINGLDKKIQIQPIAIVDKTRVVRFLIHSSSSMGKAAGSAGRKEEYDHEINVKGTSVDDFVFKGRHPAPDIIKMDIEGGEVLAVQGMQRLLKEKHPIFLVELHGKEAAKAVWAAFHKAGYDVFEMKEGYRKIKSLDELDWKAYILAKKPVV